MRVLAAEQNESDMFCLINFDCEPAYGYGHGKMQAIWAIIGDPTCRPKDPIRGKVGGGWLDTYINNDYVF